MLVKFSQTMLRNKLWRLACNLSFLRRDNSSNSSQCCSKNPRQRIIPSFTTPTNLQDLIIPKSCPNKPPISQMHHLSWPGSRSGGSKAVPRHFATWDKVQDADFLVLLTEANWTGSWILNTGDSVFNVIHSEAVHLRDFKADVPHQQRGTIMVCEPACTLTTTAWGSYFKASGWWEQ